MRGHIKVYTSLDTELVDIFSTYLENCKKRLWIMIYVLTLPYILREIVKLHKDRKDVKIILSNDSMNVETVKFLEANGVPVKVWRQTYGILHTKLVLLDDYVIFMSANLTHYGLNRNQELMMVIRHPKIVKQLEKMFLGYWRTT
jgi:phosphatidylserine/phosphatidylglycerophosphate/cardiolipin synthase-like enzyme